MKRARFIVIGLIGVALIYFVSCQKNDRNNNFGTLRVSITDDPFPVEFIDEASITITKVEIRKKDSNEGNPFITIYDDTTEYDLLELRNGIVADLPGLEVPVGSYDLIRIYVDKASISIKDFNTYDLKVPSGSQTGIKVFIEPDLRVEGGLTTELLLDFNLDKSFVLKGNTHTPAGIKGFNFKPVIRAVNNSTAGRIEGMVSDTSSVILPNAEVWIMKDTTIAKAYTDSTGFYAILGIEEGPYSLFSTKENYDTVMYNDVVIISANRTVRNFELTPKN